MIDCPHCKAGGGVYDLTRECCVARYHEKVGRFDPIRRKAAEEARQSLQKAANLGSRVRT